jgi:hypothetical protein
VATEKDAQTKPDIVATSAGFPEATQKIELALVAQ